MRDKSGEGCTVKRVRDRRSPAEVKGRKVENTMTDFRLCPSFRSSPGVQIQFTMAKALALSMHKIEHVLADVSRDRSATKLRRAGSIPSVRQTCHIFLLRKSILSDKIGIRLKFRDETVYVWI
jgi:hypothetical protein